MRHRRLEDAAIGLVYLVVVDRGVATAHQTALVELPQFDAMRTPPLSIHIPALVFEPDRDAVFRKAPEVLLQPAVQLAPPLASQKVPDRVAAFEELVAVAPLRVLSIRQRHPLRVAGVPGVLGRLYFLPRALLVEWGHRGPGIFTALLHTLPPSLRGRSFFSDPYAAVIIHHPIVPRPADVGPVGR